MKINKILGGMAMAAVLSAGFASCSNEMDGYHQDSVIGLRKAPKAIAYAGDRNDPFSLGFGSAATRANGDNGVSWNKVSIPIDKDFEENYVDNKLPEYGNNLEGLTANFEFYTDKEITFEMCPVFAKTSQKHDLGLYYYDEMGVMHKEIIYSDINPWTLVDWQGNATGIQITIPANVTFGFFIDKNNTYVPLEDNPYNNSVAYDGSFYSNADLNPDSYYIKEGGSAETDTSRTSKIHVVTWNDNGKTYIGFEDWADFDYQDLVFTTSAELTVNNPDTTTPEEPKNEELCPVPGCGHPVHNGEVCEKCPEGSDCNPDLTDNVDDNMGVDDPEEPSDEPVVTPENPAAPKAQNEVEVNLALDEKEGDDFASHLSIHVRAATDVEIFIPVPAKYYCEADDMEIVMKHEANHMEHGGPEKFTWTLKDSDLQVSLYVQYEEEGIRIWTDGITQEVIDWCYEKCEDGITFEVWNYFNDPEKVEEFGLLSKEELRGYLDKATIKFLDEVPDYYVNAFGTVNDKYDAETNPNGDDFHVTPVDEQVNNFDELYEGEHNNGSNNNEIYPNKNLDKE